MKTKRLAKVLLYSSILLGLGWSINNRSVSLHPAIASYNALTSPEIKTDYHAPRQYRYRFYPRLAERQRISRARSSKQLAFVRHRVASKDLSYEKPYRITSARKHTAMYLKPNYPIWNAPYRPGLKFESSTNRLAKSNQLVELYQKATNHHHTFYRIVSNGYMYGWVSSDALIQPTIYQLPFQYYSQLYPLKAPDACEAVSLRMALSVKGHDPRISMRKFIDRIPHSKDPNKGYTASPYKYGDSATIYPKALAKYARRYDRHAYPRTGLTKHHMIYELEHGNPIVFEGSYRMHDIESDHTLVLVGYSKSDGYLEFADPFYRKGSPHKPISWVSIRKFTKLFHQSLHGARAVVIK